MMTRMGPLDILGSIGRSRGYDDLLRHANEVEVGGASGHAADTRREAAPVISGKLQPLQLDAVAAYLGELVLGLLYKPAVFGTAENLR